MEINVLSLEKETKFRDFINQTLENVGQDCGNEWWKEPSAAGLLSQLAEAPRWAVSDSIELHMEDTGNLVVAVWNGGTDAQGLDMLIEEIRRRIEKITEARKPAFKQKQDEARAECRLLLEKLEITLLFFTRDFKSRIALEMKFSPKMRNDLKRAAVKKFAVPITTGCTFIVYQEYLGEKARIRGINRCNSLQMPPISGKSNIETPEKPVKETIRSTVVTVQLRQLVDLYNQTGDQLFKKNVRFGIGEAFDVSKAMRSTLEEEPECFWYKNNGVTLLVEDPEFRLDCTDELQLGTLEAGGQPRFSIVNGAQTITISAKYAFEQEYLKENDPDRKGQYEQRLKKFAEAQVLLRVIHVPIQSEQDEAGNETSRLQTAKDLANDISVSLNRQKPIRQEDIAFSTPFVQKLTEYLSEAKNNAPFQLIRRGEENAHTAQLNLVDFSRARLTCSGQPGRARTASSSEIMKMDLSTESLLNTTIFVEDWIEPEANEEAVFRRSYGAVWFADQIARAYVKAAKPYKSENENAQTAVQNGKWYFTALAVQLLNKFKTDGNGEPDFSAFDESVQTFTQMMPQAVEIFSRMAVHCAGDHQLDSNDFKNEEYYQQMLAELRKVVKGNTPFKEFSELFFPAPKNSPPEKQKPSQQRITSITLGSNSDSIPVKTGKEAFEKTICYILQEFSPDPAQLAQYDSWLTIDAQKVASKKGNFNRNSPSFSYCGQKYWIGSEMLNNDSKFSCVRSLCKLANIPRGNIYWFIGKEVRYDW